VLEEATATAEPRFSLEAALAGELRHPSGANICAAGSLAQYEPQSRTRTAALLLACAAPSTATGAPWSAPVDLGPPGDYVLAPGVAFAHTGFGLLTWQRRAQPTLAGGLPGATSVILKQPNDGVASRALALGLPAATVQATTDSIAAGPVFEDRGRGLVLRTLSVSSDGDGNRRRRLSWSAVSGAGRIGRAHTIATATLGADPSLAEDHRGNAIAAWSEYSPTSAKSDVGTYRIRAAWRPAGKAFDEPVTLYGTDPPGYAHNGAVTAAIGHERRAVIAFADLQIRKRRDLKRVLVWSRTPRRGFAGPQAIGRHSDAADFALAVTDRGRIFVAWGTQDGGEEANTPWILRVATRRPDAVRFGAARVLDRGASRRLRPPDGALRLVADPEGHGTLAWTAVRPGATYRTRRNDGRARPLRRHAAGRARRRARRPGDASGRHGDPHVRPHRLLVAVL
jgi:hypothetical protein